MVAVAWLPLPSDAAGGQSVVSCPQYGEMSHGGAPRDTPVKHGPHYLGFEHPYFEPERCDGLIVR